jgi:hypothetical protein
MNITPIPALETSAAIETEAPTPVAQAIEVALEAVATIEPIPPVAETPPAQQAVPVAPPLVEIDALPTILAYLGTEGHTVRDIGTSYIIDNEWETFEQLMGAQDAFATSRLMEDQIRSQNQPQQQQYAQPQQQYQTQINSGGALVAPYQLTPQTTVLNPTPRNTIMGTVKNLDTNTALLMLLGGMSALVGVLVLLAVTREAPTEKMVREQREIMEKTASTLSSERAAMGRDNIKLANKAIDKAGNAVCISIMGCRDNQPSSGQTETPPQQPKSFVKPEAAALLAKWKAKSNDPNTLSRWASAMGSGNNTNGLTEADMRGAMNQ